MTTNILIKSKLNPPNRVLSDPYLSKVGVKKKLLSTCRSENYVGNESNLLIMNMRDSKLHSVNLQIPSLNSPELVINKKKSKGKKAACIKGFSSKINEKTFREIKSRKSLKDGKNIEGVRGEGGEEDKSLFERSLGTGKNLEHELKKAFAENKKLKKLVKDEKMNDILVEDMMSNFKSRLYKFLYD